MISRRALRSLTPAMLVTATRCLSSSSPASAAARGASAASSAASSVTLPENLDVIRGLEPRPVWSHFAALSSIPRPSKKEKAVLDYVRSVADENGLRCSEDDAGNLCVFRPGSGGGEDSAPVILQGHVDMVTEKNEGTNHDFDVDPIRLRRIIGSDDDDGDWIGATGTTLGADNGIGVAAALAILSASPDECRKPIPPIEALFTVDEETGLTGAMELDAEALGLTGRTMLNLDTEEWGDLYVGCAGGGETEVTLPLNRRAAPAEEDSSDPCSLLEIRVDGLMGGHSGINIHEGRANAVLLCAAAARAALDCGGSGDEVSLLSIRGGDKHNAIPREASSLLSVKASARAAVEAAVERCRAAAMAEFGTLETGLRMGLSEEVAQGDDGATRPLDGPSADKLLAMLLAIPVGPAKYSHVIPDLVETSNNLASVVCDEDMATVLCSSRSSVAPALESMRDRIQSVATLAGATAKRSEVYPGWAPNPNSAILAVAKDLLRERLGREPGVKAIHAGLECGLLQEKMGVKEGPDGDGASDVVDMLSFGPTITGAHSPDERIDAATVPPFFELVEDILAELAKNKA